MPGKFTHIILILLAMLSIAAAIAAIATENMAIAWLGAPGMLLLLSLFHELGHLVSCVICGQKIKAFYYFTLHISRQGIQFRKDRSLRSCCIFAKGSNDLAVYAGGPIASLLAICIAGAVLRDANLPLLCLYGMLSLLHLLANTVPYRSNDMKRIIEIIREKRYNKL